MKRDKYDKIFSDLVRERADWICECCGRNFEYNHGRLHCSHYQGRRTASTRYHPLNAFAHCAACHRQLGERPADFQRFYVEKHGQTIEESIVQLSHQTIKMKPWMREEIYKHYLKEQERIKELRMDGIRGYIGFTAPAWYFTGDLSLLEY